MLEAAEFLNLLTCVRRVSYSLARRFAGMASDFSVVSLMTLFSKWKKTIRHTVGPSRITSPASLNSNFRIYDFDGRQGTHGTHFVAHYPRSQSSLCF